MSEALRILAGESAPAIPSSQLLLDDVFDILRKASVAESRQDTGRFGFAFWSRGVRPASDVIVEQRAPQLRNPVPRLRQPVKVSFSQPNARRRAGLYCQSRY